MTKTTPPDAQAAQDALLAAVARDKAAITRAVEEIIKHGAGSTYAALCGWAAVATSVMFGPDSDQEETWYIETIDTRTGEQVSLNDTTLPQGYRTAFQMITAFKNDDHAMMTALFKPHWENDESDDLFELIASMLDLSATAARHHMNTQHPDGQA